MRLLGSLIAVALLASGCAASGDAGRDADGLTIVTAFYPLAYAAERVGDATVVNLTPPGVEPHDLELSAADVEAIAAADLVVYVPGFQPAVDEAVAQYASQTALSALTGIEVRDAPDGVTDPHVWLDPMNEATIGQQIAKRLGQLEPEKSAQFAANAETFTKDMTKLDDAYTAGLAQCATRTMVVSHDAFGYLARAYDLTQIGVAGVSPETEPSPARLAEVASLVRANGVTTIYTETLVDPKVSQTLADATGATAAVLDPIEGLVSGSTETYESLMTSNLSTLQRGQACT